MAKEDAAQMQTFKFKYRAWIEGRPGYVESGEISVTALHDVASASEAQKQFSEIKSNISEKYGVLQRQVHFDINKV